MVITIASSPGTIRLRLSYPLADVPQAMRDLEAGHARGKIVITFPVAAQHE